MTGYALFLATLERRAMKEFLGGECIFWKKIKDFLSKNTLAPIDFLPARLLSEAKNST